MSFNSAHYLRFHVGLDWLIKPIPLRFFLRTVVEVDTVSAFCYNGDMKTCKHCSKEFAAKGKKLFCTVACQQKNWAILRNKSGKHTKDSRDAGILIRSIKPTDRQKGIILGAMMGDSSITQRENGTCRLRLCCGEKQKDYLEWKKNELKEFIVQKEAIRSVGSAFGTTTVGFSYDTVIHPFFQELFPKFYVRYGGKKRRTFDMNILNQLTPLSVLIWFLDDGCYYFNKKKSDHSLYLSTCRYSLSEIQMMKKWFWHTWHIESVIYYDKTHDTNYLHFRRVSQFQFNNLFLKPFKEIIPSCMYYKFPNF